MAKYFHLAEAPSIVTTSLKRPQLAVTRIGSLTGLDEPTATIPSEDAFFVSVSVCQTVCPEYELWVGTKNCMVQNAYRGALNIFDLRQETVGRVPYPFDTVQYYFPRATLDNFTDDAGLPRVDTLSCPYAFVDDTMAHLTDCLLPTLDSPQQMCNLFMDYFTWLLCARLVERYSHVEKVHALARGGLVPWQRTRVAEMIRNDLSGNLRLSTLATECGYSVSHFARCFKQTFRMSLKKYVLLQRIDHSKGLMQGSTLPLTAIAHQSGFADHAAFTRSFSASEGVPPAQWRRHKLSENKNGYRLTRIFENAISRN